MGLGLFLVRAAAAKHGGRVEAGTTSGVTTVAITLPQG
jgi:signal transduction histidine kinase